jgi:DNA (cytosine-5)-methyltransferase 1
MDNALKKNLLTLDAAAKKHKVTPDAIKTWHKKGLIKAQLGSSGERLFSDDEIKTAKSNGTAHVDNWGVLTAEKTNITVIELFCGAGGLALGLENAGLKTQLVVDYDKDSIKTIQTNRPKWNSICDSVADIDLHEYKGKIDVMAGGFPCQAFSYAGNKLGFADTRGTLFYEFVRLIKQVKPKIILGENVKGLLNHDQGRTLKTMVKELEKLGYNTKFKVLRSQFLDVPQKRERLIIFGVRKDLDINIVFPKEKNYTIPLSVALKKVPKSSGTTYSSEKRKIMEQIPEGGYWKDLPINLQKKYMGASFFMGGGKTGMARRLAWNEPSLTLTCNPAQKQTERCHPSETRPLTVREYARIQCFPDEWKFEGSVSSQYKQIGNAVPVNLGYQIGLALRFMLGRKARKAFKPAELEDFFDEELLLFDT